jgi:hypothetical protein
MRDDRSIPIQVSAFVQTNALTSLKRNFQQTLKVQKLDYHKLPQRKDDPRQFLLDPVVLQIHPNRQEPRRYRHFQQSPTQNMVMKAPRSIEKPYRGPNKPYPIKVSFHLNISDADYRLAERCLHTKATN